MRARHIGITTVAAAAAVLAVATPATAMKSDAAAGTTGPDNRFVMWQHDSYQGQEEARVHYDSNLHNDKCSGCDPGPGGNFGDDMSSFVNNTDVWWGIYLDQSSHSTEDNDVWCVRPNSHDADLGNNGFSNLEDEVSSVRNLDGLPLRCSASGHKIGYAN